MNPRLIGGEMLLWSDLDGTRGPGPLRANALAPLLAAVTGRTLVVGPHDPELLAAVPNTAPVAGPHEPALLSGETSGSRPAADGDLTLLVRGPAADGDLTLLVRGLPDAEALSARFAVLCGGPAKLAAEPPWDTIVALDGLGRLGSAEDPQLPWEEAFEQLLAVLRPGGTLLLGVENFLGVHRLVAMPPAPSDSDWTPVAAYDETRPAGLAAVQARLTAAGLTISRTYAAFPSPLTPTALLSTELLADDSTRGYVEAVLDSACTPLDDVLTDPRQLAINAARHNAAADLAPGWIFVAHRHPSADPGPEALLPTGAAGPIPAGHTLESLLLGAALKRDLPALRNLLAAWQSGHTAAVPAGQVIVTPDGTQITPPTTATPQPLPPALPATSTPEAASPTLPAIGTPEAAPPALPAPALPAPGTPAPGTPETASLALPATATPEAALHAFAVRVLSGGFAHPWPAPASPADLTVTLAAMAGIELNPAAIPTESPRPSMQDLIADRDRLTQELAEARARDDFQERTIADRDLALRRARQINALLSTTKPARALLAGARLANRTVRRIRR